MVAVQLELWANELPAKEVNSSKPVVNDRKEPAKRSGAGTKSAPKSPTKPVQNPFIPENDAPQPTSLERLRRQVAALETGGKNHDGQRISCGVEALDRMLPGGGITPGTIVEWVEKEAANGAGWLSLLAARSAISETDAAGQPLKIASGGRLVVIDIDGSFYPLAAVAAGIPLDRIIIVRPTSLADGLWAADQALRNPAVSAVWGRLPTLDDRQARRLQLAAETGRTLGLWLRPGRALSEPSWAEVRWFVHGLETEHSMETGGGSSRYLETRLVRCRGGRSGTSVTLEIDSSGKVHHVPSKRKTAAVPLVAQLADPTSAASTGTPKTAAPQTRERRSA